MGNKNQKLSKKELENLSEGSNCNKSFFQKKKTI